MVVMSCHVCDKNAAEAQRLGTSGFMDGEICPICLQPTCRHHLATVRWRWRNPTRDLASTLVCIECKRAYKHRDWDPAHREWIS
jgi:uncharacterized protein YbaR (Trm112 family)